MARRFVSVFAIVLVAAVPAAPALAEMTDGDLVGQAPVTYTVVAGDSLATVARQNHVGYVELLSANPALISSTIHPGESLTIPTQHLVPRLPDGSRPGIIVNLAALRLYRFSDAGQVSTYPISVGKEGWDTPTGTTNIIEKRKDPTWTVPASIRAQDPKLPAVVPAGPDNPLGQFAMNLGWPGYLIHGTNHPYSIGRPSSHGCMRLYPEDIEALFGQSAVGDAVTVIDTPMTLGEAGGNLYLQVTPTRAQAKEIAGFETPEPLDENDPSVTELKSRLSQLVTQGVHIDDAAVIKAIFRHDGMPVVIAQGLPADLLAVRTTPQTTVTTVASTLPARESWGATLVHAFLHVVDNIAALFRNRLTA